MGSRIPQVNLPRKTHQPAWAKASAQATFYTADESKALPSKAESPVGLFESHRYRDLFIPRYNEHRSALPPPPILSYQGAAKPPFREGQNAMPQWLSACQWNDDALEPKKPIRLPFDLGISGVDRDGVPLKRKSRWLYESPELREWRYALHPQTLPVAPETGFQTAKSTPKARFTLEGYSAHKAQKAERQNSPTPTQLDEVGQQGLPARLGHRKARRAGNGPHSLLADPSDHKEREKRLSSETAEGSPAKRIKPSECSLVESPQRSSSGPLGQPSPMRVKAVAELSESNRPTEPSIKELPASAAIDMRGDLLQSSVLENGGPEQSAESGLPADGNPPSAGKGRVSVHCEISTHGMQPPVLPTFTISSAPNEDLPCPPSEVPPRLDDTLESATMSPKLSGVSDEIRQRLQNLFPHPITETDNHKEPSQEEPSQTEQPKTPSRQGFGSSPMAPVVEPITPQMSQEAR